MFIGHWAPALAAAAVSRPARIPSRRPTLPSILDERRERQPRTEHQREAGPAARLPTCWWRVRAGGGWHGRHQNGFTTTSTTTATSASTGATRKACIILARKPTPNAMPVAVNHQRLLELSRPRSVATARRSGRTGAPARARRRGNAHERVDPVVDRVQHALDHLVADLGMLFVGVDDLEPLDQRVADGGVLDHPAQVVEFGLGVQSVDGAFQTFAVVVGAEIVQADADALVLQAADDGLRQAKIVVERGFGDLDLQLRRRQAARLQRMIEDLDRYKEKT